MQRLAPALLLILAACGTEKDDRPLEIEYLTQAIFGPSCGQTQCHSSFAQANGAVFDTPEMARATLVNYGWITFDYQAHDPSDPDGARLIRLISLDDPFPTSSPRLPRMPYDAPLANKDQELLKTWIWNPERSPDGEGGYARGAQCNPEVNDGHACNYNEVVRCGVDWNFGELVRFCPNGCVASCFPPTPACGPGNTCPPEYECDNAAMNPRCHYTGTATCIPDWMCRQ